MSTLVVNTNENLLNQDAMLMAIAESTVASFKLEGIEMTVEEALLLAEARLKERKRSLRGRERLQDTHQQKNTKK